VDLRAYYRKVREVESGLAEPFVVVVSHETSDGGKPGVLSEVTRRTAAQQIAEGRSRAATREEADAFHKKNLDVKQSADEAAAVNRMELVVVPARPGTKGSKERD
jgi:hypothetical protein